MSDEAHLRAALLTELGLVECRITDLSTVVLPLTAEDCEATRALLDPGVGRFREAVNLSDREGRACYCLGLWSWADGEYFEAARHFEAAEAAFRGDPIHRVNRLEGRAVFHVALSLLLTLSPGTERQALEALKRALEAGYAPSDDEWRAVLEALAPYLSGWLGDFLFLAATHCGDVDTVIGGVVPLAVEGRPEALDAVDELVARLGPTPAQKFDLLGSGLIGAIRANDRERAEAYLERIDEFLTAAASGELDRLWLEILERDRFVRDLIGGIECDLIRLTILERNGRREEALDLLQQLLRRLIFEPSLAAEARDLFEDLVAHQAPEDVLAYYGALLGPSPAPARGVTGPNVGIVFVGGDERQAKYQDAVMAKIDAAYSGRVKVFWIHPGWGADWTLYADQAAQYLKAYDALVLMRFVRTNLGRRLRRLAGEFDRPWVPCTGHGAGSIERAIHRAVAVVMRRRDEGAA